MGVRGLASLCDEFQDLCLTKVSIAQMAEEYKSKHNKIPELVIDMKTCIHFLYRGRPFMSGIQFKELANLLEKFLLNLQSVGLQITGYFSGMKIFKKITLKKYEIKWKTHKKMYNGLHLDPNFLNDAIFRDAYPEGLWRTVANVFRKCNCKIFQAMTATQNEISHYLRDNDCFGLLSYDTDFIIFNCANFFSMKHLDWDALTTYLIKYENLADILQIDAKLIPLWAALSDNAFVANFYNKSFYTILDSYNFDVRGTLLKVARFVNLHFKPDVDIDNQLFSFGQIAYPLLSGRVAETSIRKSLQYYDLNYPHDESFSLKYSSDPMAKSFQDLVREKHRLAEIPSFFFSVLFTSFYNMPTYPENPNERNNYSFEMTHKIRGKIYGILLMHNTRPMVDERYSDLRGLLHINRENPVPPRMKVDVLELWREDESEKKWDLFFLSLNILSRDILLLEFPHLYIPVFALKYMIMDRMDIKTWELEAIIVSMLLLKDYSIQDLESIKDILFDPHAIHLYWIWTKMIDVVTLLNFTCGCPIKPEFTDPAWFQDGQLFHKKYLDAKTNCGLLELCEGREDIFNSTLEIKRLIFGNQRQV